MHFFPSQPCSPPAKRLQEQGRSPGWVCPAAPHSASGGFLGHWKPRGQCPAQLPAPTTDSGCCFTASCSTEAPSRPRQLPLALCWAMWWLGVKPVAQRRAGLVRPCSSPSAHQAQEKPHCRDPARAGLSWLPAKGLPHTAQDTEARSPQQGRSWTQELCHCSSAAAGGPGTALAMGADGQCWAQHKLAHARLFPRAPKWQLGWGQAALKWKRKCQLGWA